MEKAIQQQCSPKQSMNKPKERQQNAKKHLQFPEFNNEMLSSSESSEEIVEEISKINGESYTRTYNKISLLGKGGFALCFKTKQKQSQTYAATKIIKKASVENYRTKLRLINEIKLHKTLKHENIVGFYNNFEDENNVYINLQLCQNGALIDLLRTRYSFSTPQIQSYVYGVCQGVKYLHSNKVIHRDLKLGNLFINQQNVIKIGDFGLATRLQFIRENKRTVCGTPNYLAPEVLAGVGYHFEVDIWAIGVIIYALFFSVPPFETEEAKTTYEKIRKCSYDFPKYHQAPPQAIDLIKKILVRNPADRLTIDEILDSPFMKLGGSIALGLPPIVLQRAPTKKQLKQWPSIIVCRKQKKHSKTFFGFRIQNEAKKDLQTNSTDLLQDENKVKIASNIPNQKNTHTYFIEQLGNNLIFYALSNGKYGIYDKSTHISHSKSIFKPKQKTIEVTEIQGSSINNVFKEAINENECQHRVILAVKYKELVTMNMIMQKQDKGQDINLIKINFFKDIKMVRFSNRQLEIIYPEGDSFLITRDRKFVEYYSAISNQKPLDKFPSQVILNTKENDKQNAEKAFKLKKGNKINTKKFQYLKTLLGQLFVSKDETCDKNSFSTL